MTDIFDKSYRVPCVCAVREWFSKNHLSSVIRHRKIKKKRKEENKKEEMKKRKAPPFHPFEASKRDV